MSSASQPAPNCLFPPSDLVSYVVSDESRLLEFAFDFLADKSSAEARWREMKPLRPSLVPFALFFLLFSFLKSLIER
jgi:hypothetical protein